MRPAILRRHAFRKSVPGLVAIALAAAVACSSTASTQTPGVPGGSLTQRLNGDWPTLDPFNGNSTTGQILAALYDRLVSFQSGKVIPYLASSWQQTPTSITFKLRTDATCVDGSKVTASLVVANWKRLLNPSKRSINAGPILGQGPYTFTADDTAATAGISWPQPSSDAIYAFTNSLFGSIVCSAGLSNPASLLDTPAGSGPYTLVSATHGDAVQLKARPDWKWGPDGTTSTTAGFPQLLTYKVVANETTAANLLLTGGLDVGIVKGLDVKRLRAEKSLTSQKAVPYTSDLLQFNEDPARITSDQAVRQALSTALDPKAWNDAANNGEGLLTSSVITPNAPCFDPETRKLVPTPSLDRARAILKSAGWTQDSSGKFSKGGRPLALKLLTNNTQGGGPEYLLTQFTQLGVTVTSDNFDYSQFATRFRGGDWDVTVGQWSLPTPGPSQIFASFTGPVPPGGANFMRTQDSALTSAIAAAEASTGQDQCKNWATVQRLVLQQSHVLPLPGQVTTVFAQTGFSFVPNSSIFLEPFALRAPAK